MNENLLGLVLSGDGGYIQIDSNCLDYQTDTLCRVKFPSFIPPVNIEGILHFTSQSDYESFIQAANLMEDLWIYSNEEFEDTPNEIYHLGEESLNALDSVLGFQSLRGQYELKEFYNDNWQDTADIYVEDDDMQIVLNTLNEVKIGNKFYKYVSNNVVAEINDNPQTLDSVRVFGIFTSGSNLKFYDEQIGQQTIPEWIEITQGCADFHLVLSAGFSTSVGPSLNRWSISTRVMNPVTGTHPRRYRDVKGTYTIDWGDGTVESFIGELGSSNYFFHNYQYPQTGFINRTITVSFQLIQQQNPSSGYLEVLKNCPSLITTVFTSMSTIKLDSYNYPDCLKGKISRKFNGAQISVNGNKYRIECKLMQSPTPASIIFQWSTPKIVATVVFQKLKNNGKWRKTKSLGDMQIYIRGEVYKNISCSNLFHTYNFSRSKNKRKKIKIRLNGIANTVYVLPQDFRTKKYLPNAINADYFWKYNNNQISVGNYNEILRP